MKTRADKTDENKNHAVIKDFPQKQNSEGTAFQLADNRAATVGLKKLQSMINRSPRVATQTSLLSAIDNGSRMVAQRQGDLEEENLLQGKFEPVQRQDVEDEELLQGKFAPGEVPIQLKNASDSIDSNY